MTVPSSTPPQISARRAERSACSATPSGLSLGIRGRIPEGATSGSTDFPIALRRAHDELID